MNPDASETTAWVSEGLEKHQLFGIPYAVCINKIGEAHTALFVDKTGNVSAVRMKIRGDDIKLKIFF
jgi:hypothetical protein